MGNPLGVARAHLLAGRALCGLGRVAEATPLLEDALVFARSIDNRQLLGFVLTAVAAAKSLQGNFAQARACNAEALAIYEALGAGRAAARTIAFDLAELEYLAGDTEAARRLATDAVDRQLALGDTNAAACTLSNLAAYLTALDRFEEAGARAHQALDLARERQLDVVAALAVQHLAAAAALRTDVTDERNRDARRRAAILVGFVDARLAELGSIRAHTDVQEYDRLVAALERDLGAGPSSAAMAEGASLTVGATIEAALTLSPSAKKKVRTNHA
jgi:tetratricopeptide (TPR) repeat protein